MAELTVVADGVYTFEDFYWHKIYGENGYYQGGNGSGIDFLTEVHHGDFLARQIAKWIDAHWLYHNKPNTVNFYELGAGDGTLCSQIFSLEFDAKKSVKYVAVDVIEDYQFFYNENIEFRTSLPKTDFSGLIFGNEFLDQHPSRAFFVGEGILYEIFVQVKESKAEMFFKQPEDTSILNPWLDNKTDGFFIYASGAVAILSDLRTRFSGQAWFRDYGVESTAHLWNKNSVVVNQFTKSFKLLDNQNVFDISFLVPFDQIASTVNNYKLTRLPGQFSPGPLKESDVGFFDIHLDFTR